MKCQPKYRYLLKSEIHRRGYAKVAQFADKYGIHRSQLSQILTGTLYPGPTNYQRLCDGLGISDAELKKLL